MAIHVSHTGTVHDKFVSRIAMLEPKQEITFSNPAVNLDTVDAAVIYLQSTNKGTTYKQLVDKGAGLIRVTRIT